MRIHASDPLKFDIGGHRGAGGGPAGAEDVEESHLLHVALEHIQAQYAALMLLYDKQRIRRNTLYTEFAYAASAPLAEIGPRTQDQFRVTYIFASCGSVAGTLYLKGTATTSDLAIPVPANTQPPLMITLGDESTGGIILERHDIRQLKTGDGSSQLLVAILAGEVLKDSYLS